MSIRSLDLRDLHHLYRLRSEAVGLDATRTLTRGNPLGAVGLMAYVNPARHIYASVADGDGATLLGGIIHTRGESFAKLLYLAPSSRLDHPNLPALIDRLSAEAGSWGAFHVLAEVNEVSAAFDGLRKAGFSVYAWQRMWNIHHVAESGQRPVSSEVETSDWRRVESVHWNAIQGLYQQIVPPLLHPVEPIPPRLDGWLVEAGSKCYVNVTQGVYGIVLTPLIHPEVVDVSSKLVSLIHHLPDRRNRPVYLCVRSYQAWLEPALEDLGARAGERQAVMVRHLTRLVKDEQTVLAAQPSAVSVQPSHVSRTQNK
ncbi:MAG TPA: hypothetical protein VLX61_11290 [Anaerolineales bacterium]|nr:hypothetical protein [Anaerolineales bacterium]